MGTFACGGVASHVRIDQAGESGVPISAALTHPGFIQTASKWPCQTGRAGGVIDVVLLTFLLRYR